MLRSRAWRNRTVGRLVSLAILVAAKGRCDPTAMSEALEEAGAFANGAVEVHLLCDVGTRFDQAPAGAWRVHRLPEPHSVFQLWGFGVQVARSTHVAILDIHCALTTTWLRAAMSRLADDPIAFYGPVEPAYPWEDRRIAGYLTEYVQFHRPIPDSLVEVAGSNLVVRRADALRAVDRSGAFVKTRLLALLPVYPVLDGDAVVLHGKPFRVRPYLMRRYLHGRSYAAERYRKGDWRRVVAAAFTAGLPLLRVWRVHRHCLRHPPAALAFRRRLGILLVAEAAWSFGELLGYLVGKPPDESRLD